MESTLPRFKRVQSLGLFVWTPGHNPKTCLKEHDAVTAPDILTRIATTDDAASVQKDVDDEAPASIPDSIEAQLSGMTLGTDEPPTIDYSHVSFPIYFKRPKDLPQQEVPNSFPNSPGYIVPLIVAMRRGLHLEEIDFVLGGSALEVLARRKVDGGRPGSDVKYIVQRVRNVIVLAKSCKYVQNLADVGFQFERLVTGGRLDGRHDASQHENLHVMDIGGHKVLFAAEVDAVDTDGKIVEVKSGNPRYFGTKVMFQMISSDSQWLVYANKRGEKLTSISKRSIDELIREQRPSELETLQERIVTALTELKERSTEISEETGTELNFQVNSRTGSVILKPTTGKDSRYSILPKKEVVDELLIAVTSEEQ